MTHAQWRLLELIVPLVVLVYSLSDLHLMSVPARARRLQQKGRMDEAIALLEKGARRRFVTNATSKLGVRYALVQMYQSVERYEDAAREAQALLDLLVAEPRLNRNGAIEADVRRRLADAYEGLGRIAEATEQKERAEAILAKAPVSKRDAGWHEAQGVQLERQNRYGEAAAEYKQALQKFGPMTTPDMRAQMEMRLALALFNAGKSAEALEHARASMASAKSATLRLMAYNQAANLCRTLNLLEDARRYQTAAIEIARAEGSPADVTFALANEASNRMMAGDIAGAFDVLKQASEASDKQGFMVRAIRHECLMVQGDFTGAIEALHSDSTASDFTIAHFDKRMAAAQAMAIAIACNELGDPARALTSLALAETEFASDIKLYRSCRAVRLESESLLVQEGGAAPDAVAAVAGLRETLRDTEREYLRLTAENEGNPVVVRNSIPHVAHAAAVLGEYETGLRLWTLYGEASPRPVYLSALWFSKGECYRGLEDRTRARDCYREAVTTGIETVWTRRARERLAEG